MERVHALLSGRLPYPMLLQGEAPKPVLLDAFQSTPSVLFASASFWEGVDVPGEALSLVVLDKLPFASPTHPVVAARIEALEQSGREPFSSYQLPEAARQIPFAVQLSALGATPPDAATGEVTP